MAKYLDISGTQTLVDQIKTRLATKSEINFVTQSEYDALSDKSGIYAVYETSASVQANVQTLDRTGEISDISGKITLSENDISNDVSSENSTGKSVENASVPEEIPLSENEFSDENPLAADSEKSGKFPDISQEIQILSSEISDVPEGEKSAENSGFSGVDS